MTLSHIPSRETKPRKKGITMMMDKGLTTHQAHGLCEMAHELIDIVKFGFGTSLFSKNIEQKIELYKNHGIEVYLGGTLLEAAYIRGEIDNYIKFADKLGIKAVEVSDGSVMMPHDEKCKLINRLAEKYIVLSEVGSKVAGHEMPTDQWVKMMQNELTAGSWKVIAEAREAGNIGIYDSKGGANTEMIDQICSAVDSSKIVWEAPIKSQQVWFVKHLGHDVNLGNISPDEIISLETIRCGLRGDTFSLHLPQELRNKVQ